MANVLLHTTRSQEILPFKFYYSFFLEIFINVLIHSVLIIKYSVIPFKYKIYRVIPPILSTYLFSSFESFAISSRHLLRVMSTACAHFYRNCLSNVSAPWKLCDFNWKQNIEKIQEKIHSFLIEMPHFSKFYS